MALVDTTRYHEKIASKGATAKISLPRNSAIGSAIDEATEPGNDAIKAIARLGGDSNAPALWEKV